jgi:hypothetical protein
VAEGWGYSGAKKQALDRASRLINPIATLRSG